MWLKHVHQARYDHESPPTSRVDHQAVSSGGNDASFANAEGKKVWFAYPRFTKGEASIVYHAGGKLFLYTLADGLTKQVSTDAKADYRYPHGEATPN